MTFLVRRVIIFFLAFELVIFMMLYCFGPKGLSKIRELKQNQIGAQDDIAALQADIDQLQRDILSSQSDLAKEKIAREKLLMKKDDETVYFI